MQSAAEKLSAHMEHDFSNGGRKNHDFSPTNCEVKGISFALFSHLCLFRNPNYYFMLKKNQKRRVVFRLSGTLTGCLTTTGNISSIKQYWQWTVLLQIVSKVLNIPINTCLLVNILSIFSFSFIPNLSNRTKPNKKPIEPNQTPIIRLGLAIEQNRTPILLWVRFSNQSNQYNRTKSNKIELIQCNCLLTPQTE